MNADREALAARLETELRELADSAKGAGSPHTYAKFMHHCTPDTILTLLDTISSLRSQIERVEKERDEARRYLETEILSHEMTAKRLDEALPLAERLPLEIERKEYWKGRYEQTPSAQKAQDNG